MKKSAILVMIFLSSCFDFGPDPQPGRHCTSGRTCSSGSSGVKGVLCKDGATRCTGSGGVYNSCKDHGGVLVVYCN